MVFKFVEIQLKNSGSKYLKEKEILFKKTPCSYMKLILLFKKRRGVKIKQSALHLVSPRSQDHQGDVDPLSYL